MEKNTTSPSLEDAAKMKAMIFEIMSLCRLHFPNGIDPDSSKDRNIIFNALYSSIVNFSVQFDCEFATAENLREIADRLETATLLQVDISRFFPKKTV